MKNPMKTKSRIASALLLAGGLSVAAVPFVHAEPGYDPGFERGKGKHCMMERGGHGHHGHRGEFGHGRDGGFFKGLDLTEAQQDKLFDIRHALAPAKREYHKEARKLREQQRELVQSADYSTSKMKQLVEQETKLTAEHRLRMADAKHKMFAVLTEEQRKQLAERQQKRRGQ